MDKVLILDDDSFAQSLLHKPLYQHYEVRATGDGSQASTWEPNVILLDMEIPGKNGCDIFEELKHQKETHDIDGSSLPSHSSARQRMPGLEVGGNDFLVKPCSPEILRRKLAKLPKYQQQKQSFKKSINTVEKKYLQALAKSFEIRKVVGFAERMCTIPSDNNLAKAQQQGKIITKISALLNKMVETLKQVIIEILLSDDKVTDSNIATDIDFFNAAQGQHTTTIQRKDRLCQNPGLTQETIKYV